MPDQIRQSGQRARTLERITAFTDATVAIALTLLVLPLVGIASTSSPDQSVADLLAGHRGEILAFAVSFLVIAQFWGAHRRVYEQLVDYDEPLLAMNTYWLMAVVLVPFPTAQLFVESRLRSDATVLYLGLMLAVSLLTLTQVWWIARHPALTGATTRPTLRRQLAPSAATAGTFAIAMVTAFFWPGAALLLLIALPLAQRGVNR